MSQPVKLSDPLVLDARVMAKSVERSIAGQIEFWAGLGRAVESLLHVPEILALRRWGAARPLSECLEEPGTRKGDRRVAGFLKSQPFPHYESATGKPGLLVRIERDGTRTTGRFVNRKFRPVSRRKA